MLPNRRRYPEALVRKRLLTWLTSKGYRCRRIENTANSGMFDLFVASSECIGFVELKAAKDLTRLTPEKVYDLLKPSQKGFAAEFYGYVELYVCVGDNSAFKIWRFISKNLLMEGSL